MISNGLGQVNFEKLWPVYAKARPDPALLEGLLPRSSWSSAHRRGRGRRAGTQDRRLQPVAEDAPPRGVEPCAMCLARRASAPCSLPAPSRSASRTRNIVDFHDEPGVAVMFLSDAGGVG